MDKSHLQVGRIGILVENELAGWAALTPVSNRSVYAGVAEVSIYIAKKFRQKGVGKKVLMELIKISEQHNIWTLQSGIFSENKVSIKLHENCGFRIIGYREKIGKLQGIWYDNIMMERRSKLVGI